MFDAPERRRDLLTVSTREGAGTAGTGGGRLCVAEEALPPLGLEVWEVLLPGVASQETNAVSSTWGLLG